ncbi:MAG: diacylglycerol kinase family lipid kinase [Clostridia bacterium]|nr:diacylglycerol kinase family lipid kinase [Clostridia bacterium]
MGIRLKIIMNPSSGREQGRLNVEEVLSYLLNLGRLERADISYTAKRFDARDFAMNLDESQYDYLMAVGGDGTVNEVISGLQMGHKKIPLAIYTAGTVNDFAYSIGMPQLPSDFARMLLNPEFIKADCGKVEDCYFLNVLAGGVMTNVPYSVPSQLKTNLGPAAYWLSALKEMPTLNETMNLTFITEEKTYNVSDAMVFLIANSRSVGGFRKLMSLAELNDGLLDVLVLSKIEPGDIFPLLGRIVMGEHIMDDNVTYFQTSYVSIVNNGSKSLVLDIDGEEGPELPQCVECIKDAVTLIVPKTEG